MAELKREYVVPLRRKTIAAPKWRRSKRAVSVLREFIKKHMKSEQVIICEELNEYLWSSGAKKPPGKVNVVARKVNIGGSEKVLVNLKEVGVDQQLSLYENQRQFTLGEDQLNQSQEGEGEVVDTQAQEKESSEETTSQEDSQESESTKESQEDDSSQEVSEEEKEEDKKKNE